MVPPAERTDLHGDPRPGHGHLAGVLAHEAGRLLRHARGHLPQSVGPGAVHAARVGERQSGTPRVNPTRQDTDNAASRIRAVVSRSPRIADAESFRESVRGLRAPLGPGESARADLEETE